MKIITTVGTSLITNSGVNCDSIRGKKFNKEYFDGKAKNNYAKRIIQKEQDLLNYLERESGTCAEIASIQKIDSEGDADILLICTETKLSYLCGRALKSFLEGKSRNVELKYIQDLQVKNKQNFENKGLSNLVKEIEKYGKRHGWYDIYLNITGGYKAIIPFLTLIGQMKGLPIFYIFEESDSAKYELIKIPQLPISFDWEMLYEYSSVFNKLNRGVEESWNSFKSKNRVPDQFDSYIFEEKDENESLIGLNYIGQFIFNELDNQYFVKLPMGCKVFSENRTKRTQVGDAIKELCRRLSLIQDFSNLKDQDLKHTNIKGTNTWIYKHSNPQIRVQYEYNESLNNLIVYNYRFITSKQDDLNYSQQIGEDFPFLKNQELRIIGFQKQ